MKLRKSVASKFFAHSSAFKGLPFKHGSTDAKIGYAVGARSCMPSSGSSSLTRVSRPSGKGRFGKRAAICTTLEQERHLNDNSNDSGFECDWNSQSDSQFAWKYNGTHGAESVEDSSNLRPLNQGPPKLRAAINMVSGDHPSNKVSYDLLKSVGNYSRTSPKERNEGFQIDQKIMPILNKAMSPDSTMRSPIVNLRGSSETISPGSGSVSDHSSSTPSPVPVKRPRFCFSPPAPSKSSGLKLRNQNGIQVRGSVGKRLPPGTTPTLTSHLSPVSRDGRVHLQILAQPEEQHRARYQTEGSRGAIKDRKCNGFPTVKLFGYDKPATLQIFIGTDQGKVSPHMFYQACKVTGKSSTPCIEKKVEGTVLIEIEFEPSKEMVISCDCVGILKERNVDVEQRFPFHHASATQSRKKSTKCRMIFRTTVVNSLGQEETLQASSLPILCTQPPGQPEICKQSMTECPASGGKELFIIGKNFLKDTRIVLREESNQGEIIWEANSIPIKDYLQQTHLICVIPAYMDENISSPVDCKISVWSGGKLSEPHRFTYLPNISAASMGLLNATAVSDSTHHRAHMPGSVSHSITMSPVNGDCQHVSPADMQIQAIDTGISESMGGSTIVSTPSAISVCNLSPSTTLNGSVPVLTNSVCSPTVDQALSESIRPPHTTIGQITPITFEDTMIASSTSTFSAVEELKTLLEQTTQPDPTQCQDVTLTDTKPEELLSAGSLLDLKPSTTFTTLAPNMSTVEMPFQNENRLANVATASAFASMGNHFEANHLLPAVTMPELIDSSATISAMVSDNSQHQILPMITSTPANGSTSVERLVTNPIGNLPTMSLNAMDCIDPMLKSGEAPIIRSVPGAQQPANPVVFINGELQGPIANALTQMSDNELINYINPSCFDQGSF